MLTKKVKVLRAIKAGTHLMMRKAAVVIEKKGAHDDEEDEDEEIVGNGSQVDTSCHRRMSGRRHCS